MALFRSAVPSGVAILVRMKLNTHKAWKKCLNGTLTAIYMVSDI